jgi:hypothetical protein
MVTALANPDPVAMVPSITAETELERKMLADPRLRAWLEWGAPRFGHPEGPVGEHVATMLAAIPNDHPMRGDLRFLTLTHDSFKAAVRPHQRWSPDNDHAAFARRFAERFTSDERLLSALKLHDEPYWIRRTAEAPEQALRRLLDRLPHSELFTRFVELDVANHGKDLTFLWWFRRELAIAGRLDTHPSPGPDDAEGQEVVYFKAFATSPEQQPAVARAAHELVAEQQTRMTHCEVLTSDDGLRVVMRWRWRRSRRELIERDADLIRDALASHPICADAKPAEARLLHAATAS